MADTEKGGALEYDNGIFWCWIVWALKPGDLRVVAICTSQDIASCYEVAGREIYPEHRIHAERAPVDHTFGGSDLRSVAHRAAMRRYRAGD